MQTVQFLQSARWIVEQYSTETKELIFTPQLSHPGPDPELRRKLTGPVLRATTELAIVAERLQAHAFAPAVLMAFGLQLLLDRSFAIEIAERVTTGGGDRMDRVAFEVDEILRPLWRGWRVFEQCIDPLEKLLVPPAVVAEKPFDDILTLELRYDGDLSPKAETVVEVISAAERMYAATARGTGASEFSPLVLIYADSGSAVRFDLKGLGGPIKELKGLLVELWNRFRHRSAEDYRANTDALLSGLRVVAGIDILQQQGVLSGEDATRYKRDLLEAGMRLFESGALPREVPRVEVVSNQELLIEVQRKLLPAAPASTAEVSPRRERKSSARTSNSRKKKR